MTLFNVVSRSFFNQKLEAWKGFCNFSVSCVGFFPLQIKGETYLKKQQQQQNS